VHDDNYIIHIHGPIRHYIQSNVPREISGNCRLYGVDCVAMSHQVFYMVLWSHSDYNKTRVCNLKYIFKYYPIIPGINEASQNGLVAPNCICHWMPALEKIV